MCLAMLLLSVGSLMAQDPGPQLDPSTLECLGSYWVVPSAGEDAHIDSAWRKVGEKEWHAAMPLRRVEDGRQVPEKYQPSVEVPTAATLFAGSLFGLTPDTAYEWKLTLNTGGKATEQTMKARTTKEPVIPSDSPVIHVVPGDGRGSGTQADPCKGLADAQAHAKPGTVFLLHAGTYPPLTIMVFGKAGKPIVWRAAGDGEVVIDGAHAGADGKRAGRGISASEATDVWFEGLTIRNADYGIVGHEGVRLVVRRCHVQQVDYGIAATRNETDGLNGWFITDNLIEGPSTWPRTKGIENARGIQITGSGHVVARNRIRGFADAIDTFPSRRVAAIDFCDNELSECTDDGIELDYSHRNTRAFRNRLTNCFQGISFQPIHGGPAYALRNVLVNICAEPFKLHNSPSGAVIVHNTVLKQGPPMTVMTGDALSCLFMRNNLFVGSEGRACNFDAAVQRGDLDHDGYVGWSGEVFIKWNGQKYATPDDTRTRAPIYHHVVTPPLAGLFAHISATPADQSKQMDPLDLRLKDGSGAVDAGEPLPGLNDDFAGTAPDLGAYELGQALPHYGPRSER